MISLFGWVSLGVLILCCAGLVIHRLVMKRRARVDEAWLAVVEWLQEQQVANLMTQEHDEIDLACAEYIDSEHPEALIQALDTYEAACAEYNAYIARFPGIIMAKISALSPAKELVKNQRGGAYIFTLTAVLLITALAVIALAVSVVSRRISAHYALQTGLYEMAVAGNEYVLLALQEALDNRTGTTASLTDFLCAALVSQSHFIAARAGKELHRYRHLALSITPENAPPIAEAYRSFTAVTVSDDRFTVQTCVFRIDDDAFPVPATVRAHIILDDYVLTMVQSTRISLNQKARELEEECPCIFPPTTITTLY